MSLKPLDIDLDYLRQVLVELLDIPSPSGRTDHVQQYVGERLSALGIPSTLTRRGRSAPACPAPGRPGPTGPSWCIPTPSAGWSNG